MHKLSPIVIDIGLTRKKGIARFLDGNTLYVSVLAKDEVTVSGCGSITLVSRKNLQPLDTQSFPKEPTPPVGDWNFAAYALGRWAMTIAAVRPDYSYKGDLLQQTKHRNEMYPIHEGTKKYAPWRSLKVEDFTRAWNDDPKAFELAKGWGITDDFKREVCQEWQLMTAKWTEELQRDYVPMESANELQTQIITSVYSFDGDKKQLFQSLNSSEVNCQDLKIEIDFLTKGIKGISNLEALIFS